MRAVRGLATWQVPFNILNATIAYAVEDIVLGDILKKGVQFFWIDWQQGGFQGGMVRRGWGGGVEVQRVGHGQRGEG